jgi:YD repeat-containing protein
VVILLSRSFWPPYSIAVTPPAGRQTRIGYFPTGDANEGKVRSITRVTDEAAGTGPTTRFAYTTTNGGPVTEVTDPIGSSTSDPADRVTKLTFNADRRLVKTVDALGRERRQEFASDFKPTAIFDPYNASQTASIALNYDAGRNLTGTTTQTGGGRPALERRFGYGEPGQVAASTPGASYLPTSEVNEQGNRTLSYFNATGNLARSVRLKADGSEGSDVRLEYDAASPGKLTGTRDPNGNLTSYGYDARGNVTSITPPAPLGATAVRYDGTSGADQALSRVTSTTDGDGRRAQYTYDALDRVTRIDFSQNATSASYVY